MPAAPIAMPENFFSSAKFDLQTYMSGNLLKGGRTQSVQQAEPRWVGEFTTGKLDEARLRAWRAFWVSLRGGSRDFLAYDPAQSYPLLYPNGFVGMTRAGGGAFDGDATISARADYSVTFQTLPSGFILVAGDVFGLKEGNLYSRHMLTANVVGSGDGSLTVVSFEPRILTNIFTTAAVATFLRPPVVMTPDPASWDLTPQAADMPPARFTGLQRLY